MDLLTLVILAIAVAHWVFGVSFPDILAWLKKEGGTLRQQLAKAKADIVLLEAKLKAWLDGHASGVATVNAAGNLAGGAATAAQSKGPTS